MTLLELQLKALNNLPGDLNVVDGHNCDICKNRGLVYVEVDGVIHQRECKCKWIRSVIRRTMRAGLGDKIARCTFESFEAAASWQLNLKQLAQAFCEDETARMFYIGGQPGCGKTHICTAVARHYINAGTDVVYMTWVDESKKLKAMVNDTGYEEAVGQFKNAQVLYIDDFLKTIANEKPTDADMKLAFEIINQRIDDKEKITIISSERTLNELIDFDEATMSRIFETAGKYGLGISRDRSKNYRMRNA